MRFANTNTTDTTSMWGSCCQCCLLGAKGCEDGQLCIKSPKLGLITDGGKCASNGDQHLADSEDAFVIGADIPGLAFRCGCFPESSTAVKNQLRAGIVKKELGLTLQAASVLAFTVRHSSNLEDPKQSHTVQWQRKSDMPGGLSLQRESI